MNCRALALLTLVAFVVIGCPGPKPPASPKGHEGTVTKPLHLSKSSLGFRLSNADDSADEVEERKVAAASPLGDRDKNRLLERLPKLSAEPGDAKDFSLRDKSLPPPRPGKTVNESFPPSTNPPAATASPTGPLTVERRSPEGPVPLAPTVSVTFSEPMVPITSVGELSKDAVPARLSPESEGTWQWLGTQTLLFQPKKRLPMATSFTVTVPAGTKATSGKTLSADVQWTFTTPPPVLKEGLPQDSSIPLDPVLFASFDQAIDPAKMLTSISVTAGGRAVPVRLATQEEIDADALVGRAAERAEKGRWLAFRPTERLPNATKIVVGIATGAVGSEGPLPTTQRQSFSFRTFGPFEVRRSHCGWGDHCAPLMPFEISFTNEIDARRFDPKLITVSPELPGRKVDVAGDSLEIRGATKGRQKYKVTIDGALADQHGQTLGASKTLEFDVGPASPRLFEAEREMVVLDPSSPKQYVLYSINEPQLRTRVYAVKPSDWKAYVAHIRDWIRPRKIPVPGRLVVDTVVRPRGAADELTATPVDLSPALDHGYGHVVVVVEPARTPRKDEGRLPELTVWVQSTDLGVQAFVESDRASAWVTKLADGSPIDGVDVSLVGGSVAAKTRQGLATLALDGGGYPLVATLGRDTAFVTQGWLGAEAFAQASSRDVARWLVFDDRRTYKPGEEVHVKGWVRVAERGRGGDVIPVHHASGKGVAYTIRDPRGAELATGRTTLDDQGAFDLSFVLPKNANLGDGNVELRLDDPTVGNTRTFHGFSIQEYRTPEFAVKTSVSEGTNVVGGHAVATVSASYYAGGALPNAPASWTVERTVTSFTPPHRSAFHFGPEPRWFSWFHRVDDEEGTKTETWTSRTNAQGLHRLRIDFDASEPPYPMNLALTSSVEDVNRQAWAGRASLLVHPSDRYVGFRLAKNFVREGEPLDVDLVVTDLEGALVGGRPVEVRVARLDGVQRGAAYEEQELDVQTCTVTSSTDSTPRRCTFATKQGGLHRITAVVMDESGRRNQSTMKTWVIGGSVPKDRSVGDEGLTVISDKNEYVPGETATVLVLSPFASAEGVLTVRRQGVVHLERFTMRGSSQSLQVKLDDSMLPNVTIAVDLVAAVPRENAAGKVDPSLPKRPAHASGRASVKVLPVTRTLAVKATPKSLALAPGSTTSIDLDVRDPHGKPARDAEVSVVVVDEAVLALSGFATPDPLQVFYASRSEDVSTIGNRERVVLADPTRLKGDASDGDAFGAGGLVLSGIGEGGGGRGMGMPTAMPAAPMKAMAKRERMYESAAADVVGGDTSPIAVRTQFAALALFAPKVRTDASGRASVPLKLPDNLTRYRVMAVASSGTNFFGAGESSITARLPLMVRPSAPRFLNFGDRFDLPVVLQNQTDAPITAGVVVRSSNATMSGEAAKSVTVPANDRVEVRFPASTVKAGTARFQIGVAAPGFADASEVSLPVYTPATTEAFATYGEIDQGAIAQPVKMPEGVFKEFGGLEITTSSTQLQALTDAVLYLVHYPFDCNEQVASRILAISALRDVLSAFKAEGLPSPKELEVSMKSDFERLTRTQNGNGGWGFWQGEPWPYLSIHVAHALVRAKEKGYSPNGTTLARSKDYLRNIEAHIPSWYGPEAKRTLVAYALYVRKRMGDADPARAKRLIREAGGVDKLPIEALGWIWPTLSEDKGLSAENEAVRRHIGNRVTETAGAAHFVTSYGDSNWVLLHSDRRADGVLLESLIGDQPNSTLIPKLVKGLLGHRKAGHWTNTQENAFVLLALDRYFATYEKVTPDFVARVWLGDAFAGEHAFKGRTTEQSEVRVPMSWLAKSGAGTKDLVLGKDGPGRLYYRIGMQYAPTDLKLPPSDHGFVVSRLYEGAENPGDVKRDADGTWRVRLGSKVRVRLSMVARARRYHVALVDPIPAGLEPMNAALAVTGEIPKDPKAEAEAAKQGGPYWFWTRTWYEHQNLRDDRVEAFASLLYDGVWDYAYVTTATTPGTFVVPPTKAEEMYAPETFGRSAGDRMIIE